MVHLPCLEITLREEDLAKESCSASQVTNVSHFGPVGNNAQKCHDRFEHRSSVFSLLEFFSIRMHLGEYKYFDFVCSNCNSLQFLYQKSFRNQQVLTESRRSASEVLAKCWRSGQRENTDKTCWVQNPDIRSMSSTNGVSIAEYQVCPKPLKYVFPSVKKLLQWRMSHGFATMHDSVMTDLNIAPACSLHVSSPSAW